jgi:uncharacterized membrane protein YbhN (UPF0104 family)
MTEIVETQPRRVPWGLLLRIGIIAIIVAFGAIYVREVDWGLIWRAAYGASWPLLVLAVLLNIPLIWLKAVRLRLLIGGRVGAGKLMGFYVASYAADNLVMSQAGLGLRVGLLAHEGIPIASAVAVQGLEKLLEGVGLALLALPLLFASGLEPWLASAIHWCLIVGGAAALALVVLALLSRKEIKALRQLRETLGLLRDRRLASVVGLLTIAAWLVEVAMVMVTFAALHLPVDVVSSVVLLVAVNVAALVPGLPANLGSFEMSGMVALESFGIAREAALGFVILYHASHTIPVTILGLLIGAKGPGGKGRTG